MEDSATPELHTARLEKLELENQQLAEQVKGLVRAERAAYHYQEQLDTQIKLYRSLSEVGQRFNATHDIEAIIEICKRFIIYDLNFERCIILVRVEGEYRCRAFDGFFEPDARRHIDALVLKRSELVPDASNTGAKLWLCTAESRDPRLDALRAATLMDDLVVFGLGRELQAILIAGNTIRKRSSHSRVEEESEFIIGLANLASQASSAIDNAEFYRALESDRRSLKELSTSLSQSNAELAAALQQAHEAARLKDEFVANISHELRTPLNSIVNIPDGLLEFFVRREIARCNGCASEFECEPGESAGRDTECPECHAVGALEMETRLSVSGHEEELAKNLRLIQRSGTHLLRIINDVLDFSKLGAGKMVLDWEQVSAAALVQELIATLEPVASKRRIKLITPKTIDPSLTFQADPVKWTQIFINLVGNAIKFSPDDGVIELSVEEDQDSLVFGVRDHGIGIAAEHQELIFDAFQQVDGSHTRKAGGTGLGLSIARNLVALHHGELWLNSKLGEGTHFFVRFPMERGEAVKLDSPLKPVASSAGQPTLVVLDDEPLAIETIRLALRPLKPRIVGITDPRKLAQVMSELRPDVLLLDVMMPRQSGLDLLRELRSCSDTKDIPVLVLSAYDANEGLVRSLGAHWMAKPWNGPALQAKVRELLQETRNGRPESAVDSAQNQPGTHFGEQAN